MRPDARRGGGRSGCARSSTRSPKRARRRRAAARACRHPGRCRAPTASGSASSSASVWPPPPSVASSTVPGGTGGEHVDDLVDHHRLVVERRGVIEPSRGPGHRGVGALGDLGVDVPSLHSSTRSRLPATTTFDDRARRAKSRSLSSTVTRPCLSTVARVAEWAERPPALVALLAAPDRLDQLAGARLELVGREDLDAAVVADHEVAAVAELGADTWREARPGPCRRADAREARRTPRSTCPFPSTSRRLPRARTRDRFPPAPTLPPRCPLCQPYSPTSRHMIAHGPYAARIVAHVTIMRRSPSRRTERVTPARCAGHSQSATNDGRDA